MNEISALHDPLILILDDYHVMDAPVIQEGMIFLMDHMPAPLHLVIATRSDPAWPLARWGVRDELTELRASDLRFSFDEVSQLLNQTMQLQLSSQDITALQERTEGWIAGLQMAGVSVQGRLKAQGPGGVSHFIETFHRIKPVHPGLPGGRSNQPAAPKKFAIFFMRPRS